MQSVENYRESEVAQAQVGRIDPGMKVMVNRQKKTLRRNEIFKYQVKVLMHSIAGFQFSNLSIP